MIRKTLLIGLLGAATLMCSCSNGGITSKTSGTIDCYSIYVYKTGSTSATYSYYYGTHYSEVYEYQNNAGDLIYTNAGSESSKLTVYKNRYASKYDEYTYVGFVGWLTYEDNYYLDVDNKVIDHETKYHEYQYEKNPNEDNSEANNQRAWKCAKKGYYKIAADYYYFYTAVIYLDTTDKSLESHEYTKLSDDCIIKYTAKSF